MIACSIGRKRHTWRRSTAVGCRENPGVVSIGGTLLAFVDQCPHCGTVRTVRRDYVTRRESTSYEVQS
jgi:hypothetical protein